MVRFSTLVMAATLAALPSLLTANEAAAQAQQIDPPAKGATLEAMSNCLWSKAPASTALWQDSPDPNVLEEFSSVEKSIKTKVWYRMFAACNAVLPSVLPVHQQDAFRKHIAATRPSETGEDSPEVEVFQCLYWLPTDDGEKKYTSGRWGYVSEGKIRNIFESSGPFLTADEQAEVQYTCSYIQSDGSLIDA